MNADPDPGFWVAQKCYKKNYLEKNQFLDKKNPVYFNLGLTEERPSCRRSIQL
jgi:hypothetical protein